MCSFDRVLMLSYESNRIGRCLEIRHFSRPTCWRQMNSEHQWMFGSQYINDCLHEYRLCSGKESFCQCRRLRRHGFNSWIRKIPWIRKWQLTPVFLQGKSHGERSPVAYNLVHWVANESDMTKHTQRAHISSFLWVLAPSAWTFRRIRKLSYIKHSK